MIQNIFKRIVNEIYIEYFKPNGWKKTIRDKLGGQKGKSPDLQLRSQSAC